MTRQDKTEKRDKTEKTDKTDKTCPEMVYPGHIGAR
jgi:hypothetical protein